jgi:hypothetical protein
VDRHRAPAIDKQFDHIDPALAAFIFRNEALRLPQPRGQFLLSDIRPSPGSGQTRADDLVLLDVGGSRSASAGRFHHHHRTDGIWYALRPKQVAVIHDADECRDETVLRIYGGHIVRVPCSLEEVVG